MDRELYKKEFTELMEKNQGIILKVSGMYCENEACKEDLFQEILLQLWKSYPTYNHNAKFSTWMYRVALNTAFSQFRKIKHPRAKVIYEIPENIQDDNGYEEKAAREKILHQAIGKLKMTEKSIIILYLDAYSYEEISDIIGISVSNVGVKINRIKSKLQKILKELGYGL